MTVVTLLWRDAERARRGLGFRPWHVRRLRDQVAQHMSRPHRFVCITDEPEWIGSLYGIPCIALDRSLVVAGKCTPRLQLFRRDAGERIGTDRILHIALGTEVVGPLDPLVERTDPLVLLRNPVHGERPRFPPFSSAVMLVRSGTLPRAYDDFVPHVPLRTPWSNDACDWLSVHAPPTVATFGPADGIHDEARLPRTWSQAGARSALPEGARLVTFERRRGPWDDNARATHPWLARETTRASA